jgi:hypothetical protein
MKPQHGIRVGDRYTWEDLRITISEVHGASATINVLQTNTGTKWSKSQPFPFPAGFIKVYSAPPSVCEACENQPPAMGMAYCDDCLDVLAETGDDAV